MANMNHPEKDQLLAFSLGKLSQDDAEQVAQHLDGCHDCSETIVDLQDDTFVEIIRSSRAPETPAPDATLDVATLDVASQSSDVSNHADPVPTELQSHPRYDVVGLIGKGGMGDVYQARHRMMDRTVALKVINRNLVRKREAVDRFHREVKAAAQLSHPNIVTAFDAEQAGDVHFLVMEFVDGTDLSDIIKERGTLSIDTACDYVRQVAIGLQHAHQRGMVHRDIKPQNLMVTEDGTVKILDFGLASLTPEVSADSDTMEGGSDLTVAGAIMGTPDFISPEQAEDARGADIRSDIYSLGGTLYYLLSGRPPFSEGSVTEKLKSHARAEPAPLESLRDDIPSELAVVAGKMMAKIPADRFQTPAEVAEALKSFAITTADVSPSSQVALPNITGDGDPPSVSHRATQSPFARFLLLLLIVIACGLGWLVLELPYSAEVRDVVRQLFASPEPSELDERLARGEVTEEAAFEMAEVNVDLAERLVGRTEHLTFTNLETLSPEVAAVLAKHPENLSFPAVKQISTETAKALAAKEYVWISLDGLEEMSPEVARELAAAKCALRVGDITPEIAKIFGNREGTTSLGLSSINPDVAAALSKHNGWLSLHNLRTIDADSAATLAQNKHWLSLNVLTSLTPDVAEALGKFDGKTLDLNGLPSIDVESATKLSTARCQGGGLYLNGLTTISPEIVNVLANGNSRTLSFQGLKQVDAKTKQALDAARKRLQKTGCQLMF